MTSDRDPIQVTLRRATRDDADVLLRWRNDAVTRANSWSTAEVTAGEHHRWLERTLADPAIDLWMARDAQQGSVVGTGRLDWQADVVDLSLTVAPDSRGRGYAGAIIHALLDRARARDARRRIVAQVKPSNVPSCRAFVSAGFHETDRDDTRVRFERVSAAPAGEQNVLFVVDAGPGIGLGHLQRSLALAAALREQHATVVFATPRAAHERVRRSGIVVEDETVPDADRVIALAAMHRCATVVIDSYRVVPGCHERLRAAGLTVIALDDSATGPLSAAVVINGSPGVDVEAYASIANGARVLAGADYALLHPAFWERAARAIGPVRTILVAVGGSDPSGLLPRLLAAVDAVDAPFEIVIIVGTFFESTAWQEAVAECRHPVSVQSGPEHLAGLFGTADLAVITGGQTINEAAATGTPAVVVQAFDNQAANVRGMAAAGAIRLAGRTDSPDFESAVTAAVHELIEDDEARDAMSRAGQRVIDAQGARRAAGVIAGLWLTAGSHR